MRRVPNRQLAIYVLLLSGFMLVAGLTSCSKEDSSATGPDESAELELEGIILNPKSPGPGDTLLATAVVTSDTTYPGDFANYAWTSNGGSFLEDNLSTVRWVAPNTSSMFQIGVTASNMASSKSSSVNVFVSDIVGVIPSEAGPMTISSSGDSLYYMSSPVPPSDVMAFLGFGQKFYSMGSSTELLAPHVGFRTYQLALSRDFSAITYVVPVPVPQALINVQYIDFLTSVQTVLPHTPYLQRAPQFLEPSFSPDRKLLTYQVWYPDVIMPPSQAGTDTFVVATWDLATKTQRRVAVQGRRTGAFGLNFHPSFSSDGRHLVYLADRSGSNSWELYALPVANDTVAVDSITAPTQLTNTGGTMAETNAFTGQPNGTAKAWNPNPNEPILAILDAASKLHLVPTSGAGDIPVSTPGIVRGFVWSPSGQEIALTTGSVIYRVDKAGTPTLIHQAASGDNISRLSWSTDEKFLLYANRRQSDVWYELLDLTGMLNIDQPLRVTPSEPQGEASTYEFFGSLSPVWDPDEPTAYILLFGGGSTPSIATISFAGLYP